MAGRKGALGNVTFGIQMGITIFIFVYGGYRLDLHFDIFPVCLVAGTFLGMGAAFYNLIKEVADQERLEKREEDEEKKERKIPWI